MRLNNKRLIVFLLVAIFMMSQIVTVIPRTPMGLESQYSTDTLLLSTNIIYPFNIFFETESSETYFLRVPVRQFNNAISITNVMPVSVKSTMAVFNVFDIRSNIEKTIQQYFYGSKYTSISPNA